MCPNQKVINVAKKVPFVSVSRYFAYSFGGLEVCKKRWELKKKNQNQPSLGRENTR